MNVKTTLILVFLFVFSRENLFAQATVLQNYPGSTTQAGNPKEFTEYNGYLYFSAASDDTGRELWRTDGTVAGTTLFLDIGEYTEEGDPRYLTLFNSFIYFVADNGVDGDQLWRTDGTPEGTIMVTNLSGADPVDLIVYNGTLFFSNTAASTGRELWKSDGTAAGTVLVKDIRPGFSSSLSDANNSTTNFTLFNNKLYFFCNDGTHGNELWETDGTTAGTVLVSDVNPGSGSSFPSYGQKPVILNGELYFVASEPTYGEELWKTNGTAGGTQLVSDVRVGTGTSNPTWLTVMGNNIYFSADDGVVSRELWKTDGTAAGTTLVRDVLVGINGTGPANLFNANGTLYFSTSTTSGIELFKSDGTTAGTVLVKDIYAGAPSSEPKNFAMYNSLIYFQAMSLNNGAELWRTDGTSAGTILVKAISPGIGGGAPNNFKVFANKLVFVANQSGLVNMELWSTDGTTAGTVLLRDINRGDDGSELYESIIYNDRLFFDAVNTANGRELFKSDGTVGGTGLFMDIFAGSNNHSFPQNFIQMGSNLYFFARNQSTHPFPKLHRTNGTVAGTTVVSGQHDVLRLQFVIGNNLYFFVNGSPDDRLYKSNGSSASVAVAVLSAGGAGTVVIDDVPNCSALVNNVFYFVAQGSDIGEELWRTDGTTAGTYLLKNIAPTFNSSSPRDLVNLNGTLYFTADDNVNGRELWKSDGTAAGTVMLKDIYPGAGASNPKDLIVVNGKIYFSAFHPTNGRELWVSDGTAAGTTISDDIEPGPESSSPRHLTNGSGRLWFTASTQASGRELWQKTGNTAPTLVADLFPGTPSSNPANLKVINGELYFGASNGTTGAEPYKTLGSACSTVSLGDLSPGDVGSYPEFFGAANNKILLLATTPFYGRELMSLNGVSAQIAEDVDACQSYVWDATGDTLLNSGLYSVIVPDQSGCDSLILIDLTIHYPVTVVDNQTACDSYTWRNGTTYLSSTNAPVYVVPGINGCDTTFLLHLTINHPSTPYSVTHTACSSYTWNFNGQTYFNSGQYTDTILTSGGCDSIATLNLTILNSSVGTDVQTECDAYTWIDGNTYYASTNTPTFTFQNSVGCDSIVTLNLTITYSTAVADIQTACDSLVWIDGNTYYASTNSPTMNLQSTTGCDSIVTLDLTITHSNNVTDIQTACDSLLWIDGNTYYASTNTPAFILQNASGCDSIVTLNLTINHSSNVTDTQVACDSYTWLANGQTYLSSGQYTDTIPSVSGCDSIVTLDLTVLHSSSGSETQTACGSYIWPINGQTYTISGQYTDTISNAASCDSIITLDLTIIPLLPFAIENTFSLPSDANSCVGKVAIDISGNADFELDFDNGSQVITSSGYSLVTNLCAGVHDLHVTNHCGDTLNTPIVIPVDSNYIFNNPFIDSLAMDSLGVTMTNCDIYYAGIDTAYIDSIWANGNTVNVIWNIVDSNGSNFDTTSYVLNNGNGVYWLQLSVFCPNKSVGEYFTVTEAIYFNNGSVSTAGLADYKHALFEVYPNPSSNQVQINFSGSDAELTVYDLQGKVVLRNRIQNQQTIYLENFERGVYLFDLRNSEGQSVKRVVKQ